MKFFNQPLTSSWSGGRHDLAIIVILAALLGGGLVYAPLVSGLVLLTGLTLTVGLIRPRFILYVALFFTLIEITQVLFYFDYRLVSYDYIIIISISSIFFLLALIYWGVGRLAGLHPPIYANTLDLPLTVICLSGLLSLLWTPFLFDGFNLQTKAFTSLIMYFAIVRLIQTPGQVESLVKFWVFAGLFLVVTFVMTFFISYSIDFPGYWEMFGGRLVLKGITITKYQGNIATTCGITGGSKIISPSLTIAIPLTVAFLCTQKRVLMRRFLQVAILLMLTLLILTMSRTDLAGLGVGWLVFVYLTPDWRPKFFRYQLCMTSFVIVAMVISVSLLLTFYPHNFAEFNQRYFFGERYQISRGSGGTFGTGSLQIRLSRILWTLDEIWDTSGIGAGSGGILRKEDPTHRRDVGTAVLSIFWEHGYGLLSYILFVWVAANMFLEMRRSLHRCQNERLLIYLRGFCWVLVAFGTMGFLDYHYVFPRFWQVLGFGMAGVQAVYQNQNELVKGI